MRAPDFWQRRGLAARLLAPLGVLYGMSVAWKARNAKPFRAAMPVICVGNLTAGGSGKTPVAIAIAEALMARGRKPYFLTRGYGGQARGPLLVTPEHDAAMIGDEALLLARTAPTIVARDRAAGAMLAQAQGADVLVMDDGHQNFALHKDLSLVVVDGVSGFGNGLMIPAGPLRELVAQGLARAGAVMIVGKASPDLEGFTRPVLHARLQAAGEFLRGKKIFAFAGIGRPEKFLASLRETGAMIDGTRWFPDHHPYRTTEIAALREAAKDAELVTTEKDLVRIAPEYRSGIAALPVRTVFDDPAALTALLDSLCPTV